MVDFVLDNGSAAKSSFSFAGYPARNSFGNPPEFETAKHATSYDSPASNIGVPYIPEAESSKGAYLKMAGMP
jgi:hypothetical protein